MDHNQGKSVNTSVFVDQSENCLQGQDVIGLRVFTYCWILSFCFPAMFKTLTALPQKSKMLLVKAVTCPANSTVGTRTNPLVAVASGELAGRA